MKKKKKRRLRQPFRFIRNCLYLLAILFVILYGLFKIFIEKEINLLVESYNNTVFDEKNQNKKVDLLNESYTIAFIGYDEIEGVKHADSINVAFVNPKTDQITISNVPRDSYVEYYCVDNKKDKLTNAMAFGGIECVSDGLENIFQTKIDFYISTNFDGVVKVIDQLGGISTDVPDFLNGETWCEEMSDRKSQTCFSDFGNQKINGQQALAIARSRQYSSDLSRGELQSQIITDTLKTLSTVSDIKVFENILLSISDDVKTNISANQAKQIAYTYVMSKQKDNQISRIQVSGVSEYGEGERAGWGSYFYIDSEEILEMQEKLSVFMHLDEKTPLMYKWFEKLFLDK